MCSEREADFGGGPFHALPSLKDAMRTLLAVLLVVPLFASAQAETEVPAEVKPPPAEPAPHPAVPVVQPVHAAVPVPNDWNVGAGIGFGTPLLGSLDATVGLAGLTGLSSVGSTFGLSTQPRMTVLIERRLGERMFLGFQVAASFRGSQSDTFSAVSYRSVNVEGTIGLRNLFNPRGVVEVSWFANLGLGYGNTENRSLFSTVDSMGAVTQTPQTWRSNGFAVGAVAGLALERELISGLALRLSSSIVGLSYSVSGTTSIIRDVSTDNANHGFDGGLRFSPTLELRYAF
jgi:hypothetical protein